MLTNHSMIDMTSNQLTKPNASLELVLAKMEQIEREKTEAVAIKEAQQHAHSAAMLKFWAPLLCELQQVEAGFPERIKVESVESTNWSPRLKIDNNYYKLVRFSDSRVCIISASTNARLLTSAPVEQFIPELLVFIAKKLTSSIPPRPIIPAILSGRRIFQRPSLSWAPNSGQDVYGGRPEWR